MKLLNDVARCSGDDCQKKEHCARYIQRETGGRYLSSADPIAWSITEVVEPPQPQVVLCSLFIRQVGEYHTKWDGRISV